MGSLHMLCSTPVERQHAVRIDRNQSITSSIQHKLCLWNMRIVSLESQGRGFSSHPTHQPTTDITLLPPHIELRSTISECGRDHSAAVAAIASARALRLSASCARFSAMRTAACWSHWCAQYPANPNTPIAIACPPRSSKNKQTNKDEDVPPR